jgi:hypothetical protein
MLINVIVIIIKFDSVETQTPKKEDIEFDPTETVIIRSKKKWQGSTICLTLHQFILMHSTMKLAPTFTLVKELYGLANQI